MKKPLQFLFYLVAFAAVSYFLRQYLNAPRSFIVSLIISLGIIMLLAWKKSPFVRGTGITLLVIHTVRLIGAFIPVYENTPDIRQRYRRNPSMLTAIQSATSATTVTITERNQSTALPANSLIVIGKPIYQGTRISTASASITSNERVMISLWDGGNIQIFPQSSIEIEALNTDYANLTGSRLGVSLESGIISAMTRRTSFTPPQNYIRAGNIYFSCVECVVGYSGDAGIISTTKDFAWRHSTGQSLTISGGTYTFRGNTLTATINNTMRILLNDVRAESSNHKVSYDNKRRAYMIEQRGWAMDSSLLLSTVSKVKMALVGLFDRTYRNKYDNLMLYEYMRGTSDTIPPEFASQEHLYKFIQ